MAKPKLHMPQGKLIESGIKTHGESKWVTISLRLPIQLKQEIDESRKSRPAITRTAWMLESFQEKLKRESES